MATNSEQERYFDKTYLPQLQEAWEYQDFVCDRLHQLGIVLQSIQSKKYQSLGENLLGMEIKYDKIMADSKNLFLETDERSSPFGQWVDSGICRPDNSWLYAVGNEVELFIFSKRHLPGACRKAKLKHVTNGVNCGRGYLLPRDDDIADSATAMKWYIRHVVFGATQ